MIQKLLHAVQANRKATAIVVPAILAWLFTILGVIILKDYGFAIFIFIPFFIGFCSTLLWGRTNKPWLNSHFGIANLGLLVYCMGLILFAIEGIICIIMAAPLGIAIAFIGTAFGRALIHYRHSKLSMIIGFGIFIPALMSFEYALKRSPEIYSTTTSIIINKPKEIVWKEVIAFSKIGEPVEWFFKAGIAYPTHAEIVGTGKGAIRYCNFSTGRFVEPITEWKEAELLRFSVLETPAPLKEISPYDIDPAHLHDYFVSRQGQFKLTELPGGKTLLEGTTWYTHKIKPAFYWKFWSDHIIHSIHTRVLRHIKEKVEL